ncbi:MAG: hypothetical protein QNJ22_07820 [Desulfosarcinaceae bacterium]|nr:hypothetical protein [Desulfosarcinaceae bacterium]
MSANEPPPKRTAGEKYSLWACLVLFSLYFVNLLMGKLNVAYGLRLPHLGNVAEFLLLSLASVLLIVAALKREDAEKLR